MANGATKPLTQAKGTACSWSQKEGELLRSSFPSFSPKVGLGP